jgi:hypothetical protein
MLLLSELNVLDSCCSPVLQAILMNTKMSALIAKSLSYLTELCSCLGASWMQWILPSLLLLSLSIHSEVYVKSDTSRRGFFGSYL